MKALAKFILEISNLKQGINEFEYEIDNDFFSQFEYSPIKESQVKLKLTLDRQSSFMDLNFSFIGKVKTECDRCLQPFFFPVDGESDLAVKFTNSEQESEDVDIVFLNTGEKVFDISTYAYEFVLLTLPISKYHDDAGQECDAEIMDFLKKQDELPKEKPNNPFGDALKDFNEN